jgi:hypothetical protein
MADGNFTFSINCYILPNCKIGLIFVLYANHGQDANFYFCFAVDSDATQDDGEGQTSELREAKVFRSENGRWEYCLGSYEHKNSENELVKSRIVGKLIIDNNKLTVRHTSNRSPLFCATVGEGFTYAESKNGVPMVYAQELGSKPKMYLIDVEENDRNDLKEALKKLSGA